MRKFIVNLAMKLQGIPYLWGGENPHQGFDCSGFVIWILQVFDRLPTGDWTADDLYKRFKSTVKPSKGDLVFYGSKDHICHIMMYIGKVGSIDNCIGASGGGIDCTTPQVATLKNAMVKIKPVKYRGDFVGYGSIGDVV
jgi:cell wall-associated NlpC family hydrolase